MREADALVFVTAETADIVMAKYPAEWRAKAHVVPHGFDKASALIRERHETRDRLRMVYTGRFYDDVRTPDALFDALARLADTRPLASELEVVLIGPHMTRYTDRVRALALHAVVELRDAVPYSEAQQAAAEADVLLVIDAQSPGASMFLTSKLVDYLLWRKPILGITPDNGATAALLQRLGSLAASPGSPDRIAARIGELVGRAAGRTSAGGAFVRRRGRRVRHRAHGSQAGRGAG